MTVVTSILGPDRGPYAPHGVPFGENMQEAEVAGEIVHVVTNPNRPTASVKMTKRQADAYLKAHPEASIAGAPEPEPEAKAVEKSDESIEDKAVTMPENKAAKKAK